MHVAHIMDHTSGKINLFLDGESHTIDIDHCNYEIILEKLKNKDHEGLKKLVDIPSAIAVLSDGKALIKDDKVYFNGSYDIFAHSSRQPGLRVDALQLETTADARNTSSQRRRFARAMAKALAQFLQLHYNLDLMQKQFKN